MCSHSQNDKKVILYSHHKPLLFYASAVWEAWEPAVVFCLIRRHLGFPGSVHHFIWYKCSLPPHKAITTGWATLLVYYCTNSTSKLGFTFCPGVGDHSLLHSCGNIPWQEFPVYSWRDRGRSGTSPHFSCSWLTQCILFILYSLCSCGKFSRDSIILISIQERLISFSWPG